mmetsp:Transcript_5706/g.12993  ORF Transcript_5706/g.12993 Transcript_5706/m.12993 type:complete len:237 (-) Transcript_5706:130-840(-)
MSIHELEIASSPRDRNSGEWVDHEIRLGRQAYQRARKLSHLELSSQQAAREIAEQWIQMASPVDNQLARQRSKTSHSTTRPDKDLQIDFNSPPAPRPATVDPSSPYSPGTRARLGIGQVDPLVTGGIVRGVIAPQTLGFGHRAPVAPLRAVSPPRTTPAVSSLARLDARMPKFVPSPNIEAQKRQRRQRVIRALSQTEVEPTVTVDIKLANIVNPRTRTPNIAMSGGHRSWTHPKY